MEIKFCAISNESIPDSEFEAGRAITVGKKSMYVSHALKRVLQRTGMRAWVTFGLALYAAALTTFLVVMQLTPKDEGTPTVPDVVEARIREVAKETEDHLVKVTKEANAKQATQLKEALDAAREHRDEIHLALSKHVGKLDTFETNVRDLFKKADDNITTVNEEMRNILAWRDEINRIANDLQSLKDRPVPDVPDRVDPPADPVPSEPVAQEPEVDEDHEAEVKRWIDRLEDKNNDIVFTATVKLHELKDLRAAMPLVKVLKDHKDFYARLGAATALGGIESVDAVPALIDALNDRDDLVRTAANEALVGITQTDFNFSSHLGRNERQRVQRSFRNWFKTNEAALRERLKQPIEAKAPPPR